MQPEDRGTALYIIIMLLSESKIIIYLTSLYAHNIYQLSFISVHVLIYFYIWHNVQIY